MAKLSDYKPTDLSSITQELENQGVMPNTNVTDTGITSVLTGDLAPTAAQLGGLEKYTLPQSLAIAGEAGLSGIKTNLLGTPKKLSTESQRLINTLQGYKRNPDQSLRFELQDVLDPELFGGSIIGKESYGSPTEEQIKKTWEQVMLGNESDFFNEYGYPKTAGLNFVSGSLTKKKEHLMNLRRQQLMNQRKQDMQQRIRQAEAAEAAKQKAAADAKAKADAAAHKKAQATGGDYHSGHQSTVDGQTTDWGDMSHMIARGGLAQHAPRYANGGLIDFFRYGGFIG
jgi:hypothetical protein